MNSFTDEIYNSIISIVPKDRVLLNEPMDRHTTFKVGGNAKAYIQITDENELSEMIAHLNRIGEQYFIKGNGSNLLVGDKGYDGVVLEIGSKYNDVLIDGNIITAKAGALMSSIAKMAYERGLTGMEFASGIPGTIGGGIVMNAGAYDGELKDIVKTVKVMGTDGETYVLDNKDMEFGYRTSIIKKRPFTVVEVVLELASGDRNLIKARMDELALKRKEKQPLEYPSAGSTFKRPEGYFAGKLIMDAGLRGYSVGGAQVSEKHCGFVINRGNATAEDVYELIKDVTDRVYDKFNVKLEPEVIFLGDF